MTAPRSLYWPLYYQWLRQHAQYEFASPTLCSANWFPFPNVWFCCVVILSCCHFALWQPEGTEREPLLHNTTITEVTSSTSSHTTERSEEDHTQAISFCGALSIPVRTWIMLNLKKCPFRKLLWCHCVRLHGLLKDREAVWRNQLV